ncbi:MAG TPA: NAD(P)/FAD-dependent oxidoreductase [Dehalococcoidia bacterium]|nr:NAD(P)/FAD-dependent oxidoreductase [Dehalococcoidia bacterium]
MAKRYDVIVVGAGPAGLMAAKTAAEDGLKVLLIERKKDLTEINRLCGQFTNVSMINTGGKLKYGYTKPIRLEVSTYGTRIHFEEFGISLDYEGPWRPYLNYIYFSPSGNPVYREKGRFFGFFTEKESLLGGLLKLGEKAGVEIMPETVAVSAENIQEGVKVRVRCKSGEESLEARRVIAADGTRSAIVESVGLNEGRQQLTKRRISLVGYVVEGVETEYRLNSWVAFTIPSLNPHTSFIMSMLSDDRNEISAYAVGERSAEENLRAFMKVSSFSSWFRRVQLVRKVAVGGAATWTPIMEPVAGNVLAIGDAACLIEVTNPGAIACGYMGAKATMKEMQGENGYSDYIAWWQKSFDTNDPDYLKGAGRGFAINAVCTDEEVDYLYRLVGGQIGVPGVLVAENLEQVKNERLELYQKLEKAGLGRDLSGMKLDLAKVLEEKGGQGSPE